MGVAAMDKTMRGGAIVASFPVELEDQIMLATSNGQSIRVPIEGISFRSRSAGGVKVFDTKESEEVVSVAWIADQGMIQRKTRRIIFFKNFINQLVIIVLGGYLVTNRALITKIQSNIAPN